MTQTTTKPNAPRSKRKQTGNYDDLRQSPTMARLLDALEAGEDVGHYGQLTFAAVAHHFMEEDAVIGLLAKQPEMDEEKARAVVLQIEERDYNPPRRERILEQQTHQKFQIIPNTDDPDSGNLYRELTFPDDTYENITEYHEDQSDARDHTSR